jgi:hypothetical protein
MNTPDNDDGNAHFDRWAALRPRLKNHVPADAPRVTLATYRAWAPAKREKFDNARIEHVASHIVVEVPQLTAFRREVARAGYLVRRPIGRTGVFLSGPAAMGKTTAAFYALLDAFNAHARRYPEWEELDHVPVVYVEVASNSNAKSIMGRFLLYLGIPFPDRLTLEERTQLVVSQLTKRRTSLVVIDEVHNLRMRLGHFETAQAIKGLMNAVPAVPVYVGMNLENTMMTSGSLGDQFAGRSTMVKMRPLGYRTKEERTLWRLLIRAFEEQLCLFNHPPGTLDIHAEALWRETQGSIGTLSRLLTTAAIELIMASRPEDERITADLLATFLVDLATQRKLDEAAAKRGRRGRAKDAA